VVPAVNKKNIRL